MCACRQKKSFFIDDILKDISRRRGHKNCDEPKPLKCSRGKLVGATHRKTGEAVPSEDTALPLGSYLNALCEEQHFETDLSNGKRETTTNFPTYPTPIKSTPYTQYSMLTPSNYRPEVPHPYAVAPVSFRHVAPPPPVAFVHDPVLKAEQILKNQPNGFMPPLLNMAQAYGFHTVSASIFGPWNQGTRRKGGQVRFTSAQTGALERQFVANKYLTPEERKALAIKISLTDKQVKTWFENRRAKWRRNRSASSDEASIFVGDNGLDEEVKTWFQNRRAKLRRNTACCSDGGSPLCIDDNGSDEEVQVTDD